MWYAYVGSKLGGVTRNYDFINSIVKKIPYATFRRFETEEQAWRFVYNHKNNYILESINCYGDIFKNFHATLEYFITEKGVYANLDTSKIGFVRFKIMNEKVTKIEYKDGFVSVFLEIKNLNSSLINCHIASILSLLHLIGQIIDINIILPNYSLFFLFTQYTGKNVYYNESINYIKARIGNVAFTVK